MGPWAKAPIVKSDRGNPSYEKPQSSHHRTIDIDKVKFVMTPGRATTIDSRSMIGSVGFRGALPESVGSSKGREAVFGLSFESKPPARKCIFRTLSPNMPFFTPFGVKNPHFITDFAVGIVDKG